MTAEYRYKLDPGSKKFTCPSCGKRRFVRYIDVTTGLYLPIKYGRCDREAECKYHLNPYIDGYVKSVKEVKQMNIEKNFYFQNKPNISPTEPIYIPAEVLEQTLKVENYNHNTFIQYLQQRAPYPFEAKDLENVISYYYLGTVAEGYRKGSITLPYIDMDCNIRAIQVKQFDDTNHTTTTDFLHSIITRQHIQNNSLLPAWLDEYNAQRHKVACLFGEHLLRRYPANPVALVEAPKTAIYGTLYYGSPDNPKNLLWLAVYNKGSFSYDRLKALQGRYVVVFPDLSSDGSTFREWQEKAREIESRLLGSRFVFSDLLEQAAPIQDKQKGYDIADYLIQRDWRKFRRCDQVSLKVSRYQEQEIRQAIANYWHSWQDGLCEFKNIVEYRLLYYNEFCRDYQFIDYINFEQYTLDYEANFHI